MKCGKWFLIRIRFFAADTADSRPERKDVLSQGHRRLGELRLAQATCVGAALPAEAKGRGAARKRPLVSVHLLGGPRARPR